MTQKVIEIKNEPWILTGLTSLTLMDIVQRRGRGGEDNHADHFDAPGLKPPNMDARIDICDIYAFQKREDTNKSILVLNVNPVAPTYADSFASEAMYELKVDTNGDAVADIAYRFTFSPKENGVQKATVRRVSGEQAKGNGYNGDVLDNEIYH